MANREVEARLKMTAVDQASRVIDKLGGRIDALGRKMETVNRKQIAANEAEKASAQAAAAAAKRRDIMTGLAVAGIYVAGRTAKKAVTDFAALEREITRIGITADASDGQIKSVSSTIMKMAQDTATPLSDVYDGFDALVSAGRSWDDALAFLPAVIKTAQAAGAETRDIAATADAMGRSMNIAGSEMQEAFDKLAKGGKMGKFELKDMASYLPSILPQMAALGYSGLDGLEKTVAMLQTLRMQTGTASEAATNLQNVLGKIYSPEVDRNFKKLFGVDLQKSIAAAKKNGIDPITAMLKLVRQYSHGDMSILSKLLPDQQLRAGVIAMLQLEDAMRGYEEGLKQATGTIETDLGRVTKNTQADIDRLANSWESFTTSLGRAVVSAGVDDWLERTSKRLGIFADFMNEVNNKGFTSATDAPKKDALDRMAASDPGAKAYIEAYQAANGGKMPEPSQVAPYMGSLYDHYLGGTPRDKALTDAGKRGGQAGALAEQYRLRGETGNYPVRTGPTMPGPALDSVIPGNIGPMQGGAFTRPDAAAVMAEGGRVYGGYKATQAYTVGSMVGGLQLPPSNENLFIGAKDQFGEFTNEVVNSMANARKEVMIQAEGMAQDLVSYINGIAIPPIKIRVEGQTQLARVNPGVSMPDQ